MQASGLAAKCIAPTGANATRFGEAPLYQEGLYDLGRGVYAWMVPNGSWGEANAGLFVTAQESLLIDTLWDVRSTRVIVPPRPRGARAREVVPRGHRPRGRCDGRGGRDRCPPSGPG